jgi:hypothetical protein
VRFACGRVVRIPIIPGRMRLTPTCARFVQVSVLVFMYGRSMSRAVIRRTVAVGAVCALLFGGAWSASTYLGGCECIGLIVIQARGCRCCLFVSAHAVNAFSISLAIALSVCSRLALSVCPVSLLCAACNRACWWPGFCFRCSRRAVAAASAPDPPPACGPSCSVRLPRHVCNISC